MTRLERQVKRVVAGWSKDLVVTLRPGPDPTIEIREKRRRSGYAITVAGLYVVLAMRAADLAIARRRAKRGKRQRGTTA